MRGGGNLVLHYVHYVHDKVANAEPKTEKSICGRAPHINEWMGNAGMFNVLFRNELDCVQ